MPYTDEEITKLMDDADPEELLTLTLPQKDFRILVGLAALAVVEIEADELPLGSAVMKLYKPDESRALRSAAALIAGYNNGAQVLESGKGEFVARMDRGMKRAIELSEKLMELTFPKAVAAQDENNAVRDN